MDYEQLRSIKNKNVQQQNELTYLEIKQTAEQFMQHPSEYPWLFAVLENKGLDANKGILISCHNIPEQFGNQWMATWLTDDERFFEIDIMADYQMGQLIEVEEFTEVFPEITAHNKGTGKSFGYLALAVLQSFLPSN